MQMLLCDAASWCTQYGAKLHVGSAKTVSVVGGCRLQICQPRKKLSWTQPDGIVSYLAEVHSHRWLGVLWSSSLNLSTDVLGKLHTCSAAFATLAGLVNGHVLPLSVAVERRFFKANRPEAVLVMVAGRAALSVAVEREFLRPGTRRTS